LGGCDGGPANRFRTDEELGSRLQMPLKKIAASAALDGLW
jgi:hypothetical protein